MVDPRETEPFREEREAHKVLAARPRFEERQNAWSVQRSTPEQRFEEMISANNNVTRVVYSMQRQFERHWGGFEVEVEPQRHARKDPGGGGEIGVKGKHHGRPGGRRRIHVGAEMRRTGYGKLGMANMHHVWLEEAGSPHVWTRRAMRMHVKKIGRI